MQDIQEIRILQLKDLCFNVAAFEPGPSQLSFTNIGTSGIFLHQV